MKRYLLLATVLSFLLVPFAAEAQEPSSGIVDEGPEHHLIYRSGEIEWQDGPASLARDAQFAVLEGDPTEPGFFTIRIRMPDGFVIAPHSHPRPERVTVLSGTFRLGVGEEVDRSAAQRLRAGTYTTLPPEMHHFVITEGETVIQLTSIGPWEINYVNPEDDPRRRE